MKNIQKNGAFLILSLIILCIFLLKTQNITQNQVEPRQASVSTRAVSSASGSSEFVMGRRVDINTASREELKLLPGIGEVLAERIVERRALLRKDGKGFYSLLELKEINGIGEKKFEAIYSYVKVDTNLGKGR